MVKTTRFDVKADAKAQVVRERKQSELSAKAILLMRGFITELAAKTGKRFSLHYAEYDGGVTEVAARDIKLVGLVKRKKIGSIYFYGKEGNTLVDRVTLSLTDGSLDKQFSLQVEEFEKELDEKGIFSGHIEYRKSF